VSGTGRCVYRYDLGSSSVEMAAKLAQVLGCAPRPTVAGDWRCTCPRLDHGTYDQSGKKIPALARYDREGTAAAFEMAGLVEAAVGPLHFETEVEDYLEDPRVLWTALAGQRSAIGYSKHGALVSLVLTLGNDGPIITPRPRAVPTSVWSVDVAAVASELAQRERQDKFWRAREKARKAKRRTKK
jgi:hypothetical protein